MRSIPFSKQKILMFLCLSSRDSVIGLLDSVPRISDETKNRDSLCTLKIPRQRTNAVLENFLKNANVSN